MQWGIICLFLGGESGYLIDALWFWEQKTLTLITGMIYDLSWGNVTEVLWQDKCQLCKLDSNRLAGKASSTITQSIWACRHIQNFSCMCVFNDFSKLMACFLTDLPDPKMCLAHLMFCFTHYTGDKKSAAIFWDVLGRVVYSRGTFAS